ncbi:UNVERIFIED_CONTAM: hypothetical protein FKN15_012961 [Acipenser sinensis]
MAAAKGSGKTSELQSERLRLLVCFLGVFVCYFYYGILQETITRGDYGTGETKEKFKYATTLVFIQCVINALFAKLRVLWTGEVWEFLSFTDRYPSVLYNIMLFGLTSALGQSFIFMTVVSFGPLTCSIITTTRKFFTILGSVLIFGNTISGMQWVGTALVFLAVQLPPHQKKYLHSVCFLSWDRKNNPEPWNKMNPTSQYKFYAVNMDYSKLKKNGPDF